MKLLEHEAELRDYALTCPSISNCTKQTINGKIVYRLYSNLFLEIARNIYSKALKNHPEMFGTKNANDVVRALFLESNASNWNFDENRYRDILGTENYCLLVAKNDDGFEEDILRIDLFRSIIEDNGCFDFQGGIFHALKHFTIENKDAGIYPSQKVNLYDLEQLIWPITLAFYYTKRKVIKTHKKGIYYEAVVEYDYPCKKLKFEFYTEAKTKISYINTIIPQGIKK